MAGRSHRMVVAIGDRVSIRAPRWVWGTDDHVFEPPKNGKGRCVELTEDTLGALKRHLTRQLEEIEALGDAYQDQGLIFPGEKGQPMRPWTLTRKLERIRNVPVSPTSASMISGTLAPRSYSRRVCTPSSFRSC